MTMDNIYELSRGARVTSAIFAPGAITNDETLPIVVSFRHGFVEREQLITSEAMLHGTLSTPK